MASGIDAALRRLAREIHDGLLAGIKRRFGAAKRKG